MNTTTTSEKTNMTETQTVRMRISPRIDRLGKIWKANLMKLERGEWKGAPGMKAANEAVNTKMLATMIKMLCRVNPTAG